MKKINLEEVFFAVSEPLKVLLSSSSEGITHPGTKGDASEFQWLKWFKSYMPKRYDVNSGFIVNHEAEISEQQDIIIYDTQYTPYLLNRDGILFVPAESVYAVFEVKQEINKKYLDYASKKIASVRKLERKSKQYITTIEGDTKAKEMHNVIGGFLSLKKGWTDGVYSKRMIKYLKNYDNNSRIDIGCCLESGSFVTKYDDGNIDIKYSHEKAALTYFFIQLITMLQNCGTCPPIDFLSYSKQLKYFEKI